MNTYVIVHLSNLSINTYYQGTDVNYSIFGGENGSPQASIHLPVPDGLTWDTVMAVRDSESGEITLVQDPTKLEAKTAQAWTSLRTQRNTLLQQSDWTQFNDSPMSPEAKAEWAQYRTALRNLPEEVTDPLEFLANSRWPSVPSP